MSVKRIHEGCESGNLPNITDWVFNEGSSSAQVGQKIDQIREKEDAAYWSCVSVKELLVVVVGREGCEKKFSRVSNIQYLEPNQLRATSTGNYKGRGWYATSRWRL